MCHTDGPGSQPPESTTDNRVISLCQHRQCKQVREATDRLMAHLKLIHHRAIQVHNAVIERAGVSVLSELCRTAGLFLDGLDEELRAAVLIPAALYGRCQGDVFGKRPLQRRIADDIDDPEAARVIQRLNATCPGVWQYQPLEDQPTDRVAAVGGPQQGRDTSVAAVIGRQGVVDGPPGMFLGRCISFRDHNFVVFAHRLDESCEQAVHQVVDDHSDCASKQADSEQYWEQIQLPLLRAVLDPEDSHRWPGHSPLSSRGGVRRPTSRSGLVLKIRRALWRHFAQPDEGLTLHAHLAALADDPEAFDALMDEVRQIVDTVTIKSGGLREGVRPVDIDEILRPFFTDGQGRLCCRGRLQTHPAAVLLVGEPMLQEAGTQRHQPIADVLEWSNINPDSPAARTIRRAWMTYCTEQNLVATYGCGIDEMAVGSQAIEPPSFARKSPVLPNLRTLFDPRFIDHSLGDLDLADCHCRVLHNRGVDIETYSLADFERDERELTRRWGVAHSTTNAVREALLDLATRWRWHCTGFDPEQFREPDPPVSSPDADPGVVKKREEHLDD